MKISGKNLKRRLYGVSRLRDRVRRARYFRGHGVHSPFVYSIVRQVFMRSTFISDDDTRNKALCRLFMEHGISHRRAVQLVNLCAHCNYNDVSIGEIRKADLLLIPQSVEEAAFTRYVEAAREYGATLVVMTPYMNRARDMACRRIVAEHHSTTVDNRGYLLVFNNHLPKQHFRL